ncbi:MAG: NAD(P)-dependent oxidoreductase [Myxococcota bacterium]
MHETMHETMHEIAIIGLGAMGSRMAQRLRAAEHPVVVCSRRRESAKALESAGATWVHTPREAARRASIVISMVTDDEASRAVWLDEANGALAGLRKGSIAVESSTLTSGHVRTLANAVSERGAAFVEAPVIGSRPQAEAGQLIYLVGGEPEVVERVEPVLRAMGATLHRTGPVGSAMAIKLAVNTLFAAQIAAWAEVIGVLDRAGIEAAAAAELLANTPVASPALRGAAPTIVARRFAPMFPIDLVHKDLRYFVQAAAEVGARVPNTTTLRESYAQAQREGYGGENITGVARVLG